MTIDLETFQKWLDSLTPEDEEYLDEKYKDLIFADVWVEGHEVISKELHDLLKKVDKDMNSQLNEINRLRKALEEIVRRNYTGASYLALTFLNDTPEEFK